MKIKLAILICDNKDKTGIFDPKSLQECVVVKHTYKLKLGLAERTKILADRNSIPAERDPIRTKSQIPSFNTRQFLCAIVGNM